MSKKVADIIVETLESAGVKHCYGVAGDTLNRIAHSISESAIEWVGVRHDAHCVRGLVDMSARQATSLVR
jgi:pyruvate dehydrogenase (quinone)